MTLIAVAAVARRNGVPVRASFWMPQKCADALIQFRADDVLEFAGLVVRLKIIDRKGVFKQPFGQAMAPHHVAGAAATRFGKMHIAFAYFYQL